MVLTLIRFAVLAVAVIPFIYYVIVLYSVWRFFSSSPAPHAMAASGFTPPISNLKPVRGLDPEAYENFASFCRQDYPQYEILFCVTDASDPALPTLQRIIHDFPERDIRVLIGTGRTAANDKVAKLARMSAEAKYEIVVMSDSDVRVEPDYLRTLAAQFADPNVGAATCFYSPIEAEEKSFGQRLQSLGMLSDFYAGILVAKQLDGVKFALGPTIASKRSSLAGFGGYAALENGPADDLLVGRRVAEQGYEVKLVNYLIRTVSDFQSFRDLFLKRLRWTIVMRNMRPVGHMGMLLTFGLPWALAAILVDPSWKVAACYLGVYAAFRIAITETIGAWGLKLAGVYRKLWLIPLWDLFAAFLWLASFTRNSIRWRDSYYFIREGRLIPVDPVPRGKKATEGV